MGILQKLCIVVILIFTVGSEAYASDPRCNAPPYGGSVSFYKAFIKNFGPLLNDPVKLLSGICNIKFGGTDRKGLYNLGITDQEIDTKDTSDLAVGYLDAIKNVADKMKR